MIATINHLQSIKHIGVALSTIPGRRISGKCYLIITDLRKKRIKYISENLEILSGEKINFKILDKKYIDDKIEEIREKINDINR